jgi:hypothetical protein
MGEFAGTLPNMALKADSNLYVGVEINPENTDELVVGAFSFTPNSNEDGDFSVSKIYDLKEDASDSYIDFWGKFTQQQSPYNFSIIDEGKVISKMMNLGKDSKHADKFNKTKDAGYLAVCELESKVGHAELDKACDNFVNGLHM